MQLLMTVRAKGVRGTAERLGSILARFEAGAARMEGYLQRYVDVAAGFGARPSLPITATRLPSCAARMAAT